MLNLQIEIMVNYTVLMNVRDDATEEHFHCAKLAFSDISHTSCFRPTETS